MSIYLSALLQRYVSHNLNLRASSAGQIAYTVRSLESFVTRPVRADECDTELITSWLRFRIDSGRSRGTVKTNRGNLLVLLHYAEREGLIDRVPRVPMIRQERRMPTAWTLDDLGRLIGAASDLRGRMRDLPIRKHAWFTSLLLFLYDSGLRVSSALTLETRDLSLSTHTAIVRASGDKTWSDQVVRFGPDTCRALQAMMGERDLVWPYPWHRRKLWEDLVALRKAAGLPTGPKYAFHCLRRTHATQAVIVAGWDAARRSLRHSDEAMTRRYVDTTQVQQAVSLELPSPL